MLANRALLTLASAPAFQRADAAESVAGRSLFAAVEQVQAVRAVAESSAGPAARLQIQQRARDLAQSHPAQDPQPAEREPDEDGQGHHRLLRQLADAPRVPSTDAKSNVFVGEVEPHAMQRSDQIRDTTPLVDENVFIEPWPDGEPPTPLERAAMALGIDLRAHTSTPRDAAVEPAQQPASALDAGKPGSAVSPEHEEQVRDLQRRDREVRAHENAHKAAGGGHAGAVHLEYTQGPDGKRYATSGEVPIDVAPVGGDPEATVRKMATVIRAATAPASPSGADRQIAARAQATAAQAKLELQRQRHSERAEGSGASPAGPSRVASSERVPEADFSASLQRVAPRRTHAVGPTSLMDMLQRVQAERAQRNGSLGQPLNVVA